MTENYPGNESTPRDDQEPQAQPEPEAQPYDRPAQPYRQPEPYSPYQPFGGYQTAEYPGAQRGEPYAGGPPSGAGSYGTAPPFTPFPAPSARPHRNGRTVLVAAVIAALVGGGIGAGTVEVFGHNNGTTTSSGINVTTQGAPIAAKTDGTVAGAAAKIQPSVVTINVRGSQEQGTGSGVIIRSDGYILTNNHVVAVAGNGGSIQVVTNDGRQASAHIVGTDPSDDLAVIKVDGLNNLTAATFGKSSDLVVGQAVVAVGAPLGLSDTVTSGIVSNTARPVTTGDNQSDQAVFDAVQTDTAINPGNSGGPLVDLNGNVVGINAAIATANSGGLQVPGMQSGNIGIGFAIPADEASRIAGQLIATGKATHAFLGVENGASGQGNGARQSASGAVIGTVEPNTPASAAGLKAGDVITKVDDQRIDDFVGLAATIRSHAPGQTVSITYTHDGQSKTVQVKLGSK